MRPGIKCLVMSAYTDEIISSNGIIDERVNFLERPFTVEGLSAKLRKALS